MRGTCYKLIITDNVIHYLHRNWTRRDYYFALKDLTKKKSSSTITQSMRYPPLSLRSFALFGIGLAWMALQRLILRSTSNVLGLEPWQVQAAREKGKLLHNKDSHEKEQRTSRFLTLTWTADCSATTQNLNNEQTSN